MACPPTNSPAGIALASLSGIPMRRCPTLKGGVKFKSVRATQNCFPGLFQTAPFSVAFDLRRLLRVRREALAVCGDADGGFSTGPPGSRLTREALNRDEPEFLNKSINFDKFTGYFGKFPAIDLLWNGRSSSGAGEFCHGPRAARQRQMRADAGFCALQRPLFASTRASVRRTRGTWARAAPRASRSRWRRRLPPSPARSSRSRPPDGSASKSRLAPWPFSERTQARGPWLQRRARLTPASEAGLNSTGETGMFK